jgi:TetR/AcrR family transcriptional regulator, tetracycline repressor protein
VTSAADARRPRGRPPRISREQIVAAARAVPARDLTMQAVADELGVSRKALHYYVGDRQGLLSLVVVDRFETELAGVELPAHGDWQAVLRSYAHAFRDGLVQVGVAIDHTPFRGAGATAALTLAERVLDVMLAAGFGADDARRGLTALASIAQASAGQHDYGAETVAALANTDEDYPALRRALADASATDAGQFEFELSIVIAGLETLLV